MGALYSRDFFALQLAFAQRLSQRFALPLVDALTRYTTCTKTFDLPTPEAWRTWITTASRNPDLLDQLEQRYRTQAEHQPALMPNTLIYDEHPLFGCFYYVVHDRTIIRPHFLKNDVVGARPLARKRLGQRLSELQQMVRHIRQHVPNAQTVQGNSWLYNLQAYRRLFPPAYTATLPQSTADEFQFLALWGQCYTWDWRVKEGIAAELLRRVEELTNLDELGSCFPYPVLQPRCAISEWYVFYDVEE